MRISIHLSRSLAWTCQNGLMLALAALVAAPTLAETLPAASLSTDTLSAETPSATVSTPATTPAIEHSEAVEKPATLTDTIGEDYILGAGDLIELEIFSVPEHSGNERVLVDGSISLEWVGNVNVAGLTLDEAADAIAIAYGHYLRNPVITVSLITPRPLQVSVAGAVNRPGSYQVDFAGENGSDVEAERRWPTLTKVLQQAGGITQLADVRQVTVERAIGRDRTETIEINLWELLSSGDLSQDLTLRDGDTILVPTVAQVNPNEAQQIASASFSPSTVRVNVVGEVNTPGPLDVPPNTPLNQALLAAGGFDPSRARTSTVELVRLNPDGTVSQREIPVSFNQGINEETNPILYPNDVIVVRPSSNARFSDSVDGILSTLGLFLPFFGLF